MKKSISVLLFIFLIVIIEEINSARSHADKGYLSFILGVAPNFLSSLILSFIFLVVLKKNVGYSLGFTIGITIYEIIQIYMPERTFDIFDIIFSFLGLLIAFIIYLLSKKNCY